MNVMRYVAVVAVAALAAAGCDEVEIVYDPEDDVKAPANRWLPDTPTRDAHEPNPGGRQMTRVYPTKQAVYHSIWPGDDVDFSYVDTRGDPGTYTVAIETEAGLTVKVWTRPGKTQGPSRLVYEKTTTTHNALWATVTTTPANPVIAIRCSGNGYLYTRYLMVVSRKKDRDPVNIDVGSTGPTILRVK